VSRFRSFAALGLLLGLSLGGAACLPPLTDYPYCFGCQQNSDCPVGASCGNSFCHYECDAGNCPVENAACGSDGFCHALDDGGC
jgi:hypothetical protein